MLRRNASLNRLLLCGAEDAHVPSIRLATADIEARPTINPASLEPAANILDKVGEQRRQAEAEATLREPKQTAEALKVDYKLCFTR
jgi:hypothetical protein